MYSIKVNNGNDWDDLICYVSFTSYEHLKEHLVRYTELDEEEIIVVAGVLSTQYNNFSYRRAMCEIHGVTFVLEKEQQ